MALDIVEIVMTEQRRVQIKIIVFRGVARISLILCQVRAEGKSREQSMRRGQSPPLHNGSPWPQRESFEILKEFAGIHPFYTPASIDRGHIVFGLSVFSFVCPQKLLHWPYLLISKS